MKSLLYSTALAIFAAQLGPAPSDAQNQQNCAPRDFVVQRLAERYGESRQAMGLGTGNAVMEVYASEESGTWTVTVTFPTGMTCMIASGQAYEELSEVLPSSFSDA